MFKTKIHSTLLVILLAIVGVFALGQASASAAIFGDANGDGKADAIDCSIILSHYNQTGDRTKGDLDNNGKIDSADLNVLRTYYSRIVAEAPPSSTAKLYVNPYKDSSNYVYGSDMAAWRASHPTETALLKKMADQQSGVWLGYDTDDMVMSRALTKSAETNSTPVFVLYSIPYRDNGQYAAGSGGKGSAQEYRAWIDWLAVKNGSRPVIFIVEPDALSQDIGDKAAIGTTPARTSAEIMAERYALIDYAATKLGGLANSKVYIDAGNSVWRTPTTIASRLKLSGIAKADGFSTNVSNFNTETKEITFARAILTQLGTAGTGKNFVIDTSRNGNGPRPAPADGTTVPGEYYWCNPPDRALGIRPTFTTGVANLDAYLWIKVPGEKDGPCNGAPAVGNFWLDYALGLASRAKW